jgi:hypothetical protein
MLPVFETGNLFEYTRGMKAWRVRHVSVHKGHSVVGAKTTSNFILMKASNQCRLCYARVQYSSAEMIHMRVVVNGNLISTRHHGHIFWNMQFLYNL